MRKKMSLWGRNYYVAHADTLTGIHIVPIIVRVKNFLVILIPVGILFFAIGIGWSLWSHNKRVQDLARATPLRVLCAENWLSTERLERFAQEHGVRIQQWTYTRPSDFLRQMANSDGKVDVLCTSSLLVKSLVRSHWLKKLDFQTLPNAKFLSVDFSHLPYDPNSDYSVPLFWNLYGFFGKSAPPKTPTWKQLWQSKQVSLWGDELNILQVVTQSGTNVEQRLQEEEAGKIKSVNEEIHRFSKANMHILQPDTSPLTLEAADDLFSHADWVQLPLARVAQLLDGKDSPYVFWLPEDGATIELGVLAVGEKSPQADLALELINELISTEQALETHSHLNAGFVHSSLADLPSILPMQKPEALRHFPLNRLRFPDVNIESLPRFQKIFDEALGPKD